MRRVDNEPHWVKRQSHTQQETNMGRYFIAWLLGVPAFVLVLVYLFMH